MFVFIGANIKKQFEFVQSVWANNGEFVSAGEHKDPIAGCAGTGEFVIPKKPIRRQLKGIPQFVETRGGEYFFMPGLKALGWLADPLLHGVASK